MLVTHMASGLSYETFSAVIDVARASIYEWEKEYPEFSDAKKRAFAKCQLYWEEQGQLGQWGGKQFNPSIWIYNMKCRFPKEGWNPRTGSDRDDNDGDGFDFET